MMKTIRKQKIKESKHIQMCTKEESTIKIVTMRCSIQRIANCCTNFVQCVKVMIIILFNSLSKR
jgi:hypothetical protein